MNGDEMDLACQGLLALEDPRREMQCGTVEVWLAYGDLERAREMARELLKGESAEWNKHWDLFLAYVVDEEEPVTKPPMDMDDDETWRRRSSYRFPGRPY